MWIEELNPKTMIEQSRNTLLFAKEVTTNAQVNAVVPDQALVKQLQREFARLETELREKDLEIEKLKKEVAILTLQRDIARSEVEDLRQVERPMKIWGGLDAQYPKLRVRNSWDYGNSFTATPVSAVGIGSCTPSDIQSCSSEECFLPLPDFNLHIPHPSSSPRLSPKIPNVLAISNLCLQVENVEHDEISDAFCKEVHCIESGSRSSMNRYSDTSLSVSPRENTVISGPMNVGNGDRHLKNITNHPDITIPSPEKPNLCPLKEEIFSRRSLNLTRSRSCEASLLTGLTSQWIEKDFNGRSPDRFERIIALKFDLQNEGLPRDGSQNSSTSAAGIELKTRNILTPEEQKNAGFFASYGGTEETSDCKSEKQLADHAVEVTEPVLQGKTVKGIGLELDPIPDNDGSSSAWLSEFKRLQKEIIELWHACNASLVHRTYFFLLFKGDPKDYIYMEVEHRRLSFLNNVFSHGNQTVENRRLVTPASSVKALRRERQMLSQRIRKRMSKAERENLFRKWGIGLNTKQRGLQLAHRMWSEPKDMNHIAESAAIVAKLVGFVDPEKTFKEMFGLNFTPGQRTHKRQCSLKDGVMSIL